jgi:hypothetical protein
MAFRGAVLLERREEEFDLSALGVNRGAGGGVEDEKTSRT